LMTDLWLYVTVLSASVAPTGLIFIWKLWRSRSPWAPRLNGHRSSVNL